MPIVLVPTPRRIKITRENFILSEPVAIECPAGTPMGDLEIVREQLLPLFPGLVEGSAPNSIRFRPIGAPHPLPDEVPPAVSEQFIQLRVDPAGVEVIADGAAGWLQVIRLLPGLKERDRLIGVNLLDWPGFRYRQLDLPLPLGDFSDAALTLLLCLMAKARLNRLGTAAGEAHPSAAVRSELDRWGIQLVAAATVPTITLLDQPALSPLYSTAIPSWIEAAARAEKAKLDSFSIALGAVDARTSIESLAYGILFAGDLAWNPGKSDLKQFRRWYSLRRHGIDSRGPLLAVDALEAASTLPGQLPPLGPVAGGNPGTQITARLEAEDLFDAPLSAGVLRPEERALAMVREAESAMTELAPLQPDTEERALSLQGLQWTAQRLILLGRRLGAFEQLRELYRSAWVATASPRAVSERLGRAEKLLETTARALDEHRSEWHALWRRERSGDPDPSTEEALRGQVAQLRARATRMHALRDKYIQTGRLPSPAEEGLERHGISLVNGIVPARLPPQPSPAWWPEGGEARLRVEVDCSDEAGGMPWEVQVDLRRLAGETGAFHIRSARLLSLRDDDHAGDELPCQLLRGGFAFLAQPGRNSYLLYLDPLPGPASSPSETKVGQSRTGVRLENRLMAIRISAADGSLQSWLLRGKELELLRPSTLDHLPDQDPGEMSTSVKSGTKLRVIETGPLLARLRAEEMDGRVQQYDLWAGQPWIELSSTAPWTQFTIPVGGTIWTEGTAVLSISESAASMSSFSGWAGFKRPDGLVFAALSLDQAADATVGVGGIQLMGKPLLTRLLLLADFAADETGLLHRFLLAKTRPPQVALGAIEERRVREF